MHPSTIVKTGFMRIFWFLPVFILSTSALSQSRSNAEQVLFSIADKPVYASEFIYTFQKNHPNQADFTEEKVNQYIDLYINFKLKVTEARHRGIDTTAKFKTEFKTYREELKKPYRTEPDALDKLTRETYERLKQEVRVAHILIATKPDSPAADTLLAYQRIEQIRGRIVAGENFEKLARESSEDPSAKINGGDLGYFTALQMVYPFEDAAYKTSVGSLSYIVRTQFGYHLLLVKDKRPSQGEVEVSHIMLRKGGTRKEADLKNEIFSVYDQIKGGRAWDEVCKEYSEDVNTKDAGGRLKPFGTGALASVPEFEATAFSLKVPGEISDPFQSTIGWHIIRLERRIPLPPFSEMEAALKRRVSRDERLQLSQQASAIKRRKAFQFQENTSAKEKVIALADSTLLMGKWKYGGPIEFKETSLITVQGKAHTVNEFLIFINTNLKSSSAQPSVYMNQLFEAWSEEVISQAEEDKLMLEQVDFRNLLNEYREGILLFEVMETEVWNKASADTAGQRKFYQENQTRYQAGERVEARIFTANNRESLTEIQNKISAGDSIKQADLKKFKSIQNFKPYQKGDSKIIDRISWSTGVHLTESDGLYYLVEVKRLIAPGTQTFDEARSQVIADYQDNLEKAWIKKLRSDYRVKVNKKGKKFVMSELIPS